jgi:hypothetical protein
VVTVADNSLPLATTATSPIVLDDTQDVRQVTAHIDVDDDDVRADAAFLTTLMATV